MCCLNCETFEPYTVRDVVEIKKSNFRSIKNGLDFEALQRCYLLFCKLGLIFRDTKDCTSVSVNCELTRLPVLTFAASTGEHAG